MLQLLLLLLTGTFRLPGVSSGLAWSITGSLTHGHYVLWDGGARYPSCTRRLVGSGTVAPPLKMAVCFELAPRRGREGHVHQSIGDHEPMRRRVCSRRTNQSPCLAERLLPSRTDPPSLAARLYLPKQSLCLALFLVLSTRQQLLPLSSASFCLLKIPDSCMGRLNWLEPANSSPVG